MEFTVTNVLKAFLESLFIGFGILIPIFSLIKTSNLKTIAVKDLFILQAVQAVRLGGIFYALLFIPQVYGLYFDPVGSDSGVVVGTIIPVDFQLYLFYPPLAYLVITQLFWIKKLYIKKPALITLALILLVAPMWLYLKGLFNLSGAPVWTTIAGNIAKRGLLNLVIFFFTTFTLMLLGGRLKKILGGHQ